MCVQLATAPTTADLSLIIAHWQADHIYLRLRVVYGICGLSEVSMGHLGFLVWHGMHDTSHGAATHYVIACNVFTAFSFSSNYNIISHDPTDINQNSRIQ